MRWRNPPTNSMRISDKHSIWNGEEFLAVRAPSIYREIKRAIAVARRSSSKQKSSQALANDSKATQFKRQLLREGWSNNRSGLTKSRVTVVVPRCPRRCLLKELYGRIAMAFATDTNDVGVVILISAKRLAWPRPPTKSKGWYYQKNRLSHLGLGQALPPAPMLVLEVAE